MQVGNVWLRMDRFGNNIRCTNVTPAEVLYLRTKFEKLAGEDPVKHLHDVKDVERTNAEEQGRLQRKFGEDRINELFGKALPSFPVKFDDMEKKIEEPGEHPDTQKQAKKPLAGLPGKSGKGFADSTKDTPKTLMSPAEEAKKQVDDLEKANKATPQTIGNPFPPAKLATDK